MRLERSSEAQITKRSRVKKLAFQRGKQSCSASVSTKAKHSTKCENLQIFSSQGVYFKSFLPYSEQSSYGGCLYFFYGGDERISYLCTVAHLVSGGADNQEQTYRGACSSGRLSPVAPRWLVFLTSVVRQHQDRKAGLHRIGVRFKSSFSNCSNHLMMVAFISFMAKKKGFSSRKEYTSTPFFSAK